jgi:RHS repeat-associated protein
VVQTKTKVVQYNEYYAHGLQTATSWTRENTTGNNYLANGGTELNTTTSLYDLDYRNFDPILGRMAQVDPMADKYSSLTPYNYSFNMPNMVVDTNGADPDGGYEPGQFYGNPIPSCSL